MKRPVCLAAIGIGLRCIGLRCVRPGIYDNVVPLK
jgi:hypothetical protein